MRNYCANSQMRLLRSGGIASSDIVLPMPFFSGFPGGVRQMPAHEMLIPAEKGFESFTSTAG